MGAGLSRHPDEVSGADHHKHDHNHSASSAANNESDAAGQKAYNATASAQGQSRNDAAGGGCPMKRTDGSYSFDPFALFRSDFPHRPAGSKPISDDEAQKMVRPDSQFVNVQTTKGCPIQHNNNRTPADAASRSSGGCPLQNQEYNVYGQPMDPSNMMPANPNQLPAATQSQKLSTERVQSSIPKGGAAEGTTWTYPSAQMFYNALARKGKLEGDNQDEESDMESIVALHNNMNEKTWRKVCEWERASTTGDDNNDRPKLLKFMGRPTDLSPKALLKHYVLGHPLPYDRHDWTVLRPDGTTVRYVIDYYHDDSVASDNAESSQHAKNLHVDATPSLLVDVRPALDSPGALWQRLRMPWQAAYDYLPLRPSAALSSQIGESVQVWNAMQAHQKRTDQATAEESDGPPPTFTQQQAQEQANSYFTILKDCQAQQTQLAQCRTEGECAHASIDLTLCMGRVLCPLQHKTLVAAVRSDEDDVNNDAEAALERLNDCVVHQTRRQVQAKQQHPALFQQK